ncbi:hypothetical protein [Baaleninema sp.]|uniref:hypothetical protein n=1 Tax=Baaleninema sp. TaxID=3101197 RepID=UPI003CFE8846
MITFVAWAGEAKSVDRADEFLGFPVVQWNSHPGKNAASESWEVALEVRSRETFD